LAGLGARPTTIIRVHAHLLSMVATEALTGLHEVATLTHINILCKLI